MRIFILFFFGMVGYLQPVLAQNQYKVINVGFYNLENLFDTLDTPGKLDEEFTPTGGRLYNTAVYTDKLYRLSTTIAKIGTDVSPDGLGIMGAAEVENRKVLEDLVNQPALKNRNIQIVHYESEDFRGIDVALLYQPKYLTVLSSRPITVPIINSKGDKVYTRQALYVAGIMDGDTVHILVNHWPSRRGGSASDPLRLQAAEINKTVKDSILAVSPHAKVIIMGDLNDNPTDKSLSVGLKAVGKENKVRPDEVFNPFIHFYKKGIGTTAYQDAWSLFDQIMVTPGWLGESVQGYRYYKAHVFNEKFLTEKTGRYKGYPLRTYSGDTYNFGYSDHFPVFISFIKKI